MNINIDNNLKLPLYFQLKEQIKQMILEGKYKDGDLIPSEREFENQFSISSTTVRRALNDLVQENFLERKAGKGTFVKIRKAKRDLRKVIGFTKNMENMGLIPSTQILSKKILNANSFARKRLGLKKGEKIIRLNRLRFADGMPMMLETRYIRKDLCPGIEKENLSASLWKVFEKKFKLIPYRHTQNMSIASVANQTAELLGLPGDTHVFLIRGVTYVQNNVPIECEESLYRSDKYELVFEAIIN